MSGLMEIIKGRRAVRKYQEKDVPEELLNRILEVEEGYEVVTLIPLGYPAHDSAAPKRREISDFTHYDKF